MFIKNAASCSRSIPAVIISRVCHSVELVVKCTAHEQDFAINANYYEFPGNISPITALVSNTNIPIVCGIAESD